MQLSDYDAFPTTLPVVVEDEIFLYPFMISPIFLTSQTDIDAATYATENNLLVLAVSSKSGHEGGRKAEDLYEYGVVGSIMRKVQLPDGRVKVLFQGLSKGKITQFVDDDFNKALVDIVDNPPFEQLKVDALMGILRDKTKTLASLNSGFPQELIRAIDDNSEPYRICDLIASMLKLDKRTSYDLYCQDDIEQKLIALIDIINSQIESAKVQKEIRHKVNTKIEQTNKEYFLKEQLKQIQKELGVDIQREEEIEAFRQKAEAIKPYIYEDAFKEITKQIEKLSRMHPESADANTVQSYLETVFEVPFGKYSKKKIDIKDVQRELNSDHYSLEKPKERIVEYFAVKSLAVSRKVNTKELNSAIICFVGPPGVGKTSLANSIATALHRPLVRIALGGLEDVNELRGHRRTYVGAMPGRVIHGFIEAKKMDPVVVLDEIDKVGASHRGDPSAALLEILDPEQNSHFRDYYLNFSIDLSRAIFIATANDISRVPAPLRDRMEIITLSSYTPKEKFEIAKRFLIPQELKKHALKSSEVYINENALQLLIEEYTREAGVRNLRKKIAGIMRKSAKILLEKTAKKRIVVTTKNLDTFADKRVFEITTVGNQPRVGVVNGLAWTAVGGDVLTIEAIKLKGKGTLQLTGSLGDVMKESAHIAFSVVKILIDQKRLTINADSVEISDEDSQGSEVYKKYDIHLHVPAGATPKDGPSAGIAMTTVIASILSGRGIDSQVAMTGEVTLSGQVLPIGGLKEKLIAAYKAGVKKAIIPQKNFERDLDEIPDEVRNSVEIIPTSEIGEVLKIALV